MTTLCRCYYCRTRDSQGPSFYPLEPWNDHQTGRLMRTHTRSKRIYSASDSRSRRVLRNKSAHPHNKQTYGTKSIYVLPNKRLFVATLLTLRLALLRRDAFNRQPQCIIHINDVECAVLDLHCPVDMGSEHPFSAIRAPLSR